MRYRRKFRKTVWGVAEVEADSIDEAQDRFDTEDIDSEFDNKSDYEWEGEIYSQE